MGIGETLKSIGAAARLWRRLPARSGRVRTNPFGAHSWAQHEDEVLNDSVEEVLRFTPILIV